MKIRNYVLLAGVLALTVACNNDEKSAATAANGQSSDLVPVTLTAQTQSSTRGAAGTTINDTYIASNQDVTVRIAQHGTIEFTDYVYKTGDNGALTLPANPPYYPTTGTIDICAYHPAGVDQYFSVQTNQSTDAGYIASDLMWSDGVSDVSRTYSAQTLTFAHKLCKIVVNATGIGGVSKINTITLNGVKPTVDFSTTTGALTGAASGDPTNITLLTDGTTGTVTATAIIPAQTITGNLITFTGKTSSDGNFTAIYKVPSGKEFTAGSVNTFTLNVSWAEVTGQNAVTDWSDGGNTPGKIYTE
jgi:hypothetical protein